MVNPSIIPTKMTSILGIIADLGNKTTKQVDVALGNCVQRRRQDVEARSTPANFWVFFLIVRTNCRVFGGSLREPLKFWRKVQRRDFILDVAKRFFYNFRTNGLICIVGQPCCCNLHGIIHHDELCTVFKGELVMVHQAGQRDCVVSFLSVTLVSS
jgi:hypothetical protein